MLKNQLLSLLIKDKDEDTDDEESEEEEEYESRHTDGEEDDEEIVTNEILSVANDIEEEAV